MSAGPGQDPDAASEQPTRIDASTPLPAAPPVPRSIGGYEIRHQIDAGGMGIVYEAVQHEPRRTVALKVMRRGLASRAALRRFEYESRLLARLNHHGIAVVYEAGTHREGGEDFPFFAMEYIGKARHLTDHAAAHSLTTDQRLALMAEVCDAVHHAHLRGIIHRDLKPANILVGSGGVPKVIDFGVARALDAEPVPETQRTEAGQLVGTLQYMSPEQIEGDPHDIDARSDVYALGLILYELLTGGLPYDVSTLSVPAATRMVRERAGVLPPSAKRVLRGDLRTVVAKALEKERERRYASADAMARDLRHLLAREPIEARPPTLAYVAGVALRAQIDRHPWQSMLAGAACWVLVAHAVVQPMVFRWTREPARAYERLAASVLPRPGVPLSLDRLRVVSIDDSTDLAATAAALGAAEFSPDQPQSLRAVHGKLMEHLAASGARAVAWDIFFTLPGPYDAALASGLRALAGAGITPILGVESWETDDRGAPPLSEAAASVPGVRYGPCTFSKGVQMSLDAALARPGQEPAASLALLAAGAARSGNLDVSVGIDETATEIRLTRWLRHRSIPGARTVEGEPERWRVTDIQSPVSKRLGVRSGDLLAVCTGPVPAEAVFDPVVIDYAEVARASPAKLRAWFDGRVVVIGDRRAEKNDFVDLPDGRRVWGTYLVAGGICSLLDGRFLVAPREVVSNWLIVGGAAVGVGAAVLCARRPRLLTASLVAAGAAGLGASLLVCQQTLIMCNPTIPLVAAVGSAWTGWGILRARRPAAPAKGVSV